MDLIISQQFSLETQNGWCSGWDDVRRSLHIMPIAPRSLYPVRVKADWAKNGDRGASRKLRNRTDWNTCGSGPVRRRWTPDRSERVLWRDNECGRRSWLAEWFDAPTAAADKK